MEQKIGSYLIVEELSSGSLFLVEDSTGAKRLLKQYELDTTLVLSDFDIKVLMSLQHKNLLPPSDTFTQGKFKYAVYNYTKLDNLQNYLKRKVKLTHEESLNISKQIINAYHFIKDHELIHGNIKPTNILVDESDDLTIKLTDFLLHHNNQKDLSNNKYIAPEIASKEKELNIISDVYSIGGIIKLLLKNTEVSTQTSTRLIEDCMQTDPNKRIQFDILTLHPYFTSTYPVYKFLHSNMSFNIRIFVHLYLH